MDTCIWKVMEQGISLPSWAYLLLFNWWVNSNQTELSCSELFWHHGITTWKDKLEFWLTGTCLYKLYKLYQTVTKQKYSAHFPGNMEFLLRAGTPALWLFLWRLSISFANFNIGSLISCTVLCNLLVVLLFYTVPELTQVKTFHVLPPIFSTNNSFYK